MKTIEIIKKAMEVKNFSNRELSQRSGINESSISLFLSGRRKPDLNSLELMLDALDIELVINS